MREKVVVNVSYAAAILGVHPWTVREWANKAIIKTARSTGGHRLFILNDLLKFKKELCGAENKAKREARNSFVSAQIEINRRFYMGRRNG